MVVTKVVRPLGTSNIQTGWIGIQEEEEEEEIEEEEVEEKEDDKDDKTIISC